MVFAAAFGLAACGSPGPTDRILEERTRWSVSLRSWASAADGSVTASVVVAGPVKSELESLTVRIDFVDAEGKLIHRRWEPLDIRRVERGTPTEFLVQLEVPPGGTPEALAVSLVTHPTPEERVHIRELAGVD